MNTGRPAPIEAAEAGVVKPDLADLGFAQGYAAAVAELRAMADRAFGDDSRRLLLCLAKDLEVIRRSRLALNPRGDGGE